VSIRHERHLIVQTRAGEEGTAGDNSSLSLTRENDDAAPCQYAGRTTTQNAGRDALKSEQASRLDEVMN